MCPEKHVFKEDVFAFAVVIAAKMPLLLSSFVYLYLLSGNC